MNLKEFFGAKRIGYYFSLFLTLMLLITGITYTVMYHGNEFGFYNVWASVFLFVGFGLAVICLLVKQLRTITPYVQGLSVFLSLLWFARGIYLYVVGMEIDYPADKYPDLYAMFITCTSLLVITLVVCIVNCFLNQKDKKVEEISNSEVEVNE